MNALRQAKYAALTSIIGRILSFALFILGTYYILPSIGKDKYGEWLALISLAGALNFFDFGIGSALANEISEKRGENKEVDLIIFSGTILLLSISILSFILLNIIFNSKYFYSITGIYIFEKSSDINIFIAIFSASIFTMAQVKIYAGLQKLFLVNVINILSTITSIILIILINNFESTSVGKILIITYGVQVGFQFFLIPLIYKEYSLIPKNNSLRSIFKIFNRLIKSGKYFFVLQLGGLGNFGLDGLIITGALGSGAYATYAIAQKLFQIVSMPIGLINAPLWHAYSDAYAKKNYNLLSEVISKSMKYTLLISSIFGFIILLFNKEVITLLGGISIRPSLILLIIFYFFTIIESTTSSFTMLLNGCNVLRVQVIATFLYLFISLILKYNFARYGIEYVALSVLIAYSLSTPIFYTVFRKIIKSSLPCDIRIWNI